MSFVMFVDSARSLANSTCEIANLLIDRRQVPMTRRYVYLLHSSFGYCLCVRVSSTVSDKHYSYEA